MLGNNGMRILYIWDADYPWDIRVEKITNALKKEGFNLHIAARNLKKWPENEILNDTHIHRMPIWKNDRNNYLLTFPFFFNPIWHNFLHTIIRKHGIDLIIVRDLPLCLAGIIVGIRNQIPVIFDMAEDYPAMNRDIWNAKKFHGMNFLLRMPILSTVLERICLRLVQQVIVVVYESERRLLRDGLQKEKISIVGNTPEIAPQIQMRKIQKYEKFTIIYTGGIQMGRGIQTVITALPYVIKRIPEFEFKIVGDGYAIPFLKKMANELGVEKHIDWTGFVDHQKIYSIIEKCHIGIVPHFSTDHTNTTIPNKIFDYMYMGLPVLSSDITPIRRILSEERCGLLYVDRDSEDLANKIVELYHDNKYLKYGANGQQAILRKYNWDNDKEKLLDVVKECIKQKRENSHGIIKIS